MINEIAIPQDEKQKFLDENYPFGEIPRLDDLKLCIHCDQVIRVGDFRVIRIDSDEFNYICCPNYPNCDGTVIDWLDDFQE